MPSEHNDFEGDVDLTDEEELDAGLPSNYRAYSARIVQNRRMGGGGYGQASPAGSTGGGYGAAAKRTDGILKHFASKVQSLETSSPSPTSANKAGSGNVKLFVSYSWSVRKEAVHQMAQYFKDSGGYNVWIDKENITDNPNTYESMAKGIDEAQVVLCFFSKAYAESSNCRREVEYAANKNKEILPVRVERGYRPDGWLLFIFKSQLRIDYCEGDSFQIVSGKIHEQIERIVNPANAWAEKPNQSDHSHAEAIALPVNDGQISNFKAVGVPFFSKSKYFARTADERRILDDMKEDAENPEEGCLVVSGDGGVGKSTLMARLLSDDSNKPFFANECKINRVLWVNCFDWRDHFDERAFYEKVVSLAKELDTADQHLFSNFGSVISYYKRKNLRCAYVLDDMFNFRLIQSFLEKHGSDSPPICFVVTRDSQTILEHDFSIVQKVERVEELTDAGIMEMLKTTFKLKKVLSDDQLMKLATLCCGLPLIASLIAARIGNCEDKLEVKSEYKTLTSPQYRISKLKTKDRSFKTVSSLFSFSLDQMDASLRMLYYAFLLFNPAEPVSVFDLGVLWGFDLKEDFRCGLRGVCRAFEKRSLVRRVKREFFDPKLGEEAEEDEEEEDDEEDTDFDDRMEDRFLVHQMLFESAIQKASKDLNLPANLSEDEQLAVIRVKLVSGEVNREAVKLSNEKPRQAHRDAEGSGLAILIDALNSRRRHLLYRIIDKLSAKELMEFCRKTSSTLTSGQSFINLLYHYDWKSKNKKKVSNDITGRFNYFTNTSYRLVGKILGKIKSEDPDLIWPAISQIGPADGKDGIPHCFGTDFFKDLDDVDDQPQDWTDLLLLLMTWQNKSQSYLEELRLKHGKDTDSLIQASVNRDIDEINKLLESEDYSENDATGWALRVACRNGYLEIAKAIVEKYPKSMDFKDEDEEYNAAMVAGQNGHLEILKFLATKNPDIVKSSDVGGSSIAVYASKNGHLDIVKFLHETSPGCLKMVNGDISPLMSAGMEGRYEVCEYILGQHPETAAEVDSTEIGAGVMAASTGKLDLLKLFAEKVENPYQRKKMVLMTAVSGMLSSIKYLAEIYTNDIINAVDPDLDATPIVAAAGKGYLEVVEFLYGKCDTVVTLPDGSKLTALMMAAMFGHLEVVQFLLSKEPELAKIRGKNDESVIEAAKRMGHKYVVQFLEEHGNV